MIYSENHDLYLKKGLSRQWMRTLWLKVTRSSAGQITDAVSLVPAIDDMDPFGGGTAPKYFVSLAVIPETAAELNR